MLSRLHLLLLGTLAAVALAATPARSDSVLYDDAGFIQGQQSYTQSFDITSPGAMTVTMSNIPWLDTIADLNFFISTPTGMLGGSAMGVGTEQFNVEPGMIYAHWFGDANGPYGMGIYGLEIQFQAHATAVPLPAALILFLSGLGLLLGWQRRPDAAPAGLPSIAQET